MRLTLAAALGGMVLLWPCAGLAEPPDIEAVELHSGEVEASLLVFAPAGSGDSPVHLRQELEFGATDWLSIELQFDQSDEGGRPAMTGLAVQATAALVRWDEGSAGVSLELARNPEGAETEFEALVFVANEFRGVEVIVNLGAEWSPGDPSGAALVYGWRLERGFGESWTAGLWGGGSDGPDEAEHHAGPRIGFEHGRWDLTAGMLLDVTGGGDNLVSIGVELSF